jgi:hypothetical protein
MTRLNQPIARIRVTNPVCAWRGQEFAVQTVERDPHGNLTHVIFLAPHGIGSSPIRLLLSDVEIIEKGRDSSICPF